MASRIEQLEQFVKEDPHDPFNIYALALEYQKFDIPKALYMFNRLVSEHSQYIATYYHLGKLYQGKGEMDKAMKTYGQGMAVAQNIGDHKTYRELQSAIRELEDDMTG